MLSALKVSSAVRTRSELEMVHGRVDTQLATLKARPRAVCAVRERVFSELYDEVIREVTGVLRHDEYTNVPDIC